MKKVIIIGATSGIGKELSKLFIDNGYKLGLAGRHIENISFLKEENPDTVYLARIDVTTETAIQDLEKLISDLGGVDIFLYSAGIGMQNPSLESHIETDTIGVNVVGFTKFAVYIFNYFKKHGGGHFIDISSIAGTRGMGAAASYSATKRYQTTYLQALSQLTKAQNTKIIISDIKPGFINTPLLKKSMNYPMMMEVEYAAKQIFKAIKKGRRSKIINWKFAIIVGLWKLLPRSIWEKLKIAL